METVVFLLFFNPIAWVAYYFGYKAYKKRKEQEVVKVLLWGPDHKNMSNWDKNRIMTRNFGPDWGSWEQKDIRNAALFCLKLYGEGWQEMSAIEKSKIQEKTFGPHWENMGIDEQQRILFAQKKAA